jgi:hypothetical protein
MSAAINLSRSVTLSCAVMCCASFALNSGAWAAESYASSMADGMPQSMSITQNANFSQQNGHNESTGYGNSESVTQRSTAAAGYNSSMTGSGPATIVRNIASETETADLNNRVLPAKGIKQEAPAVVPASASGLIENNVKQKPSDFLSPGEAPAKVSSSIVTVNRVPRVKVQYWNQRRTQVSQRQGKVLR